MLLGSLYGVELFLLLLSDLLPHKEYQAGKVGCWCLEFRVLGLVFPVEVHRT